MNRGDLQNLAQLRLEEARSLHSAGYPSGAYYLAGYAVECGLKAVIARRTQQYDFPEKDRVLKSYVHDLPKLVVTAQLIGQLRSKADSDALFGENWTLVSEWSEETRYSLHTAVDAEDMIEAVGNGQAGVLAWIMEYW